MTNELVKRTYLKFREVFPLKELKESRDEIGIDYILDRRIFLL
jgi:hypothetical protein